ncbi:MAG: peptidylprolyl isomerase, partial [Polyangiaceae bacterium]
ANIAAQAQEQQGHPVTAADILAEVGSRGLTAQDFRDEIRRQILEGKLIELRVRQRVHVTDEDARAAYQHWVKDLHDREMMDVRILALRLAPTSTQPQRAARMALAEDLAQRARSGEDFCKLISQYSDDLATKGTCGSRGAQPFGSLIPKIQEITRATKTGKISDPVEINLGQDDAIVILMPLGESRVPPFEQVKSDMTQKALIDGLDRARKQWLAELRRNVYIDVRL